MRKRLFNLLYLTLFAAMTLLPVNAFADATAFDPVPVSVKALGGNEPIGTLVTWMSAQNPPDYEKYMECDGRAIDPATYPELYALYGSNIPDLRGVFLRGVGGKSGELGELQAEGVYIDPASAKISIGGGIGAVTGAGGGGGTGSGSTSNVGGVSYGLVTATSKWSGVASRPYDGYYVHPKDPLEGVKAGSMTPELPVKLSVSGADETRPVNMATRYLIRATN
ncbi:MAG: phage tail protein [Deltaproteobacteria bacterium]|jgi:hypothetical protein|nr:phage tail protein [Deltaproteobacteria bacterium]